MPALKAAADYIELPIEKYAGTAGIDGSFRASALILDADTRVCIISCDVLALDRESCDVAAKKIEEQCNIPFDNIFISSTHTHHSPGTVTLMGMLADEQFMEDLENAVVEAAKKASDYIQTTQLPNEVDAEFFFAKGNEATVGKNSRFLLQDGCIAWLDHTDEQIVRPTGPLDPELPMILIRRPMGALVAGIFNHANHNIGFREHPVSPGFYALAGREAEERHGGVFMFLPGAFGSTHPIGVPVNERIKRVGEAIDVAASNPRQGLIGPLKSVKVPFKYRVRQFDDAAEEKAVSAYCDKYLDPQTAAGFKDIFCGMRAELAPHQGEERETWLQVIQFGDVALVGVPGELFTTLGMEIKNRSPFRHTIVTAIANDYIGYIPDEKGMEFGGYQTWAGLQSLVEKGTGEAIVDASVDILNRLAGKVSDDQPIIRDLAVGDALALQTFYNSLDRFGRTVFRPMGWTTAYCDCEGVVKGMLDGARYDVVIEKNGAILGWAFIVGMEGDYPVFGIGVSEKLRGMGYGRKIMGRVIDFGRRNRTNKGIDLTVVLTNDRARLLYESFGFRITGTLDGGGDGLTYYSMRLEFDAHE
ncbi:MAG: GNAT family N-acetyltransferase [Armatimonadota bacterium]